MTEKQKINLFDHLSASDKFMGLYSEHSNNFC